MRFIAFALGITLAAAPLSLACTDPTTDPSEPNPDSPDAGGIDSQTVVTDVCKTAGMDYHVLAGTATCGAVATPDMPMRFTASSRPVTITVGPMPNKPTVCGIMGSALEGSFGWRTLTAKPPEVPEVTAPTNQAFFYHMGDPPEWFGCKLP